MPDGILSDKCLRESATTDRKDPKGRKQAYAHNMIAAKSCCQVGGAIESPTGTLNPIRPYVWTAYRNGRNVHKAIYAVEVRKLANKT